MRWWIVIVALLLCIYSKGQSLSIEDLVGNHFYVESFESKLPLYFEKGDTIILKKGVKFEALLFEKRGKLKVVESWQWCGTMSIFERIGILIFGSVKYRKGSTDHFEIFPEKNILWLQLGGDIYFCKIQRVTYDNSKLETVELYIEQKNPEQKLLRN